MAGSGGLFGQAKQKANGAYAVKQEASDGESEAIARQRAIANGIAPSYSQMAFNQNLDQGNRAAMAMAASQRGVSNPMLAFRQAQMANQQSNLEGSQQAAIMAEQERRNADAFLQQTAAGQRGISLQSALGNQQADMAKANGDKQMIVGIGGAAAKAAMAAHGDVVPGKANVPGDSELNDTVPYMLSPGEVVVPRTAASDPKLLKLFMQKMKIEEKLKAGK